MPKNLIFVHGFFGDSSGLTLLSNFFDTQKYHIFIPNLPPSHNHYLSKYDTNSYANYLKKYLVENKIDNPILIGHSMGSIIVSAFAEKYPDLIDDKIILLSPISHRPALFFRILQPLIVLFPIAFTNFCTTIFLSFPKNYKHIRSNLKRTLPSAKTNKNRLHILKSALFSCSTSVNDFRPNKQILMINGDKENLIKSSKTQALLKANKNAKLITLKKTGHLLPLERPAETAKNIINFIN